MYFRDIPLVAVLGSLPHRIRDGIGLGWRELGVGERTGDGVRVEHAPPIIAEDADTEGASDGDVGELGGPRGRDHRRVARGGAVPAPEQPPLFGAVPAPEQPPLFGAVPAPGAADTD